jgi:PilZ domain
MLPEKPRARRYAFLANIELIDVESERKLREQTCDLSLFGCQVKCLVPLPAGTKVRLKITYKGAAFTAAGRIANVRGTSMGVVFTNVADKDQSVIEKWMAELRGAPVYQ